MGKPAEFRRSAPQLYVVTPPLGEVDAFAGMLDGALAVADIAAVLLRLNPDGERTLINRIKTLASVVQAKDVALVLDGHAELVARAGADGAHLTGIEAFTGAVEGLRPARIAGCGGLKTRHDAMVAAERGADYVMFGESDASGSRPAFPAIVERVEWWAELFEIPCVAFAAEPGEVALLAAAGADFIALGGPIWDDPRGPAAAIAAAAQLVMPETA